MPTLPHLRCQAPGFVCSSCFSPFKSITVESADSSRFFALYYIKTDKMPSCSHREDFVVDFSAEWRLNWIQRGLGTQFLRKGRRRRAVRSLFAIPNADARCGKHQHRKERVHELLHSLH